MTLARSRRIALSLAATLASLACARAEDGLRFGLSDSFSLSLIGNNLYPTAGILSPRAEIAYRGVEASLAYRAPTEIGIPGLMATGLAAGWGLEIDAGLSHRFGAYAPRVGIGWCCRKGFAGYLDGETVSSLAFRLEALRFEIPVGKDFSVLVSALELGYGPVIGVAAPSYGGIGNFILNADLARIGLRYAPPRKAESHE
jgi:hypothetical protein